MDCSGVFLCGHRKEPEGRESVRSSYGRRGGRLSGETVQTGGALWAGGAYAHTDLELSE